MVGRDVIRAGFAGQTSSQILEHYRKRPEGEGTLVVWVGNNNFDDPERVEADVDAIAKLHADPRKLLVIGLVNGDYPGRRRGEVGYQKILGYNARQASRLGDHFLDIRSALIGRVGGSNPGDVLPTGIRRDKIHFNFWGNWLVARIVYLRLKQLDLTS